jgi:hypothetical protein
MFITCAVTHEGHIQAEICFFIYHAIEHSYKMIIATYILNHSLFPLIQEDIEMLGRSPIGMPDMHFFRHSTNVKGVKAGTPFGKTILYKWWKKACDNLGVNDVDLYGGIRHSSAIGLRKIATPEQIKMATMHSTNKAF